MAQSVISESTRDKSKLAASDEDRPTVIDKENKYSVEPLEILDWINYEEFAYEYERDKKIYYAIDHGTQTIEVLEKNPNLEFEDLLVSYSNVNGRLNNKEMNQVEEKRMS